MSDEDLWHYRWRHKHLTLCPKLFFVQFGTEQSPERDSAPNVWLLIWDKAWCMWRHLYLDNRITTTMTKGGHVEYRNITQHATWISRLHLNITFNQWMWLSLIWKSPRRHTNITFSEKKLWTLNMNQNIFWFSMKKNNIQSTYTMSPIWLSLI